MNKILIPTLLLSMIAVVMVFGSVTSAFADSDGEAKSHKRHWVMPIGDSVGTIEISEDTHIDDVKDKAISQEQATQGYDVDKAKLKKAINNSGQYFLVWKLVDYTESNTKIYYVLDAGTGEQLTEPITKEKGSCGDKKSYSEKNA
ncbi:hypothetical protein [Nitrosopumilus sp.]|uniref:hypothetical protein n=1 Tax=Nitrosopumilus sp. TaxID=2024843 RepID=UPI00349FD625